MLEPWLLVIVYVKSITSNQPDTLKTIKGLIALMQSHHTIKEKLPKIYSHGLINNL